MTYVVVLLILVGLLAATNLLLTVGVIRRLREHTARITELGAPAIEQVALPAGGRIGDFSAIGLDGRPISAARLGDQALIGVFSPHCSACSEQLPQFVQHAGSRPPNLTTLAVVAGEDDDTRAIVDQVRAVSAVVVEPPAGPIQQALAVTGYPAFLVVDDGVVQASTFKLSAVVDFARGGAHIG